MRLLDQTEIARDVAGFEGTAKNAADALLHAEAVLIVAHIDADGITAASIASAALTKSKIMHRVRFVKKLDDPEIKLVNQEKSAVWLVDLGSGSISKISNPRAVISDHHKPEKLEERGSGQSSLLNFISTHVNPHLFGIDGSSEVSGAGVTYCIARAMDKSNSDLSHLAIVGAVGDLQDQAECQLLGFNRSLLDDAIKAGCIQPIKDIRMFGRETRPIARMLQYSTDPFLPGLTNEQEMCHKFLQDLEIEQTEGERWRVWCDLDFEERRRVVSALVNLLLDHRRSYDAIKRLVGEVYTLDKEARRTELHDAKEFATLLNACGRYGEAEIGRSICRGDRGENLHKAIARQQNHRETLAEAINLVKEMGIERRQYIQHFHAHGLILDSIVGIVAGMAIGSGEFPSDIPIIAFADAMDDIGKVKVSARGTRDLVRKGLDLASAIKIAAEKVGGAGGGHNVAAGATIDEGKEEDFLQEIEKIVGGQLSSAL